MDCEFKRTSHIHRKKLSSLSLSAHKIKIKQQIAILLPAIQLPCPPFTNVGVDLCGPLVVKAMTNKRATMKVWNVLFVRFNTKAVTMYLAPGYVVLLL